MRHSGLVIPNVKSASRNQSGELGLGNPPLDEKSLESKGGFPRPPSRTPIFFAPAARPKNRCFTLRNRDLEGPKTVFFAPAARKKSTFYPYESRFRGSKNCIFFACGASQTDDLPLEITIWPPKAAAPKRVPES